MLKSFLFTHDDLDGAGCRIVYQLAHIDDERGKDYDFKNCSINWLDKDVDAVLQSGTIDTDTEIIFADICASKEILTKLKDVGYHVMVFDHHATNEHAREVFPDAIIMERNSLGVQEAGTSLLYKYYAQLAMLGNSGKLDPFLELFVDTVRSYDTYEWKDTGNQLAKDLYTLFFMLGMDTFCELYLDRIYKRSGEIPLIGEIENMFVQAKNRYEQMIIDTYDLKDVTPVIVRGKNLAFTTNTKGLPISELAYQFLQKHQEFDGMASFTFAKNGKFEFRSVKDDIDLGKEIAEPIGGGGHPKAAGASLSDEDRAKIIEILVNALRK